jgi:hypothetical protein
MRLRYKKFSLMLAAFLIFMATILAVLENARVTNLFQKNDASLTYEKSQTLEEPIEFSKTENAQNENNLNGDKSLTVRERGKK